MSEAMDPATPSAPEGGTRGAPADALAEPIRVRAHIEHAGELMRAQRWSEAELELLRALAAGASDLRALKLLALVRFKLGRYNEARETYQVLAKAVPDDGGVHFDLGLIALKLDMLDEAVAELEVAARLQPSDLRTWSYLGYAYTRTGRTALAVEAFQKAGQDELAREASRVEALPAAIPLTERPTNPTAPPPLAPASTVTPAPVRVDDDSGLFGLPAKPDERDARGDLVEGFAPPQADEVRGDDPRTLMGFVLGRLLPSGEELAAAPGTRSVDALPSGLLRLRADARAWVRASALVAAGATLEVREGERRARGRFLGEPLASGGDPFLVCDRAGELVLAPTAAGELRPLVLEDDILYVRTDRVVAFDGDLAWESGELPRCGLPLLQFRGSGRVVLEMPFEDVVALKLPPEAALRVSRHRILGWVGRVVVQAGPGPAVAGLATCEGEGVVLLFRHGQGQLREHLEQRP